MAKTKVRYVIKLGTRVLTQADGSLAEPRVREFLSTIHKYKSEDTEFVLVTSGAVGLGRKALGLEKDLSLAAKQACAAVGQVTLMEIYKKIASECGLQIAQILLTHNDFTDRNKYLNLRETLETLLNLKVLPILNENDPVSVEEIRQLSKDKSFGDNDRLSAIIAGKLDADLLVLLTDVEGVHTDNPKENPKAKPIKEIPDIRKFSTKVNGKSDMGRGGMGSKLDAARVAALAGVNTVIASGLKPGVLETLLKNPKNDGTFITRLKKMSSKRRWIGFSSGFAGVAVVNEGAQEALEKKGASLLPAGVVKVLGDFKKGDVIKVENEKGEEIARGLSAIDSETAQKVIGKKSSEIKKMTSQKVEDFIHRDNMVVFIEVSHE